MFLNYLLYGVKDKLNTKKQKFGTRSLQTLRNQPFNKFKTIFKNGLIEGYDINL